MEPLGTIPEEPELEQLLGKVMLRKAKRTPQHLPRNEGLGAADE
jgi:hypothetical protein